LEFFKNKPGKRFVRCDFETALLPPHPPTPHHLAFENVIRGSQADPVNGRQWDEPLRPPGLRKLLSISDALAAFFSMSALLVHYPKSPSTAVNLLSRQATTSASEQNKPLTSSNPKACLQRAFLLPFSHLLRRNNTRSFCFQANENLPFGLQASAQGKPKT